MTDFMLVSDDGLPRPWVVFNPTLGRITAISPNTAAQITQNDGMWHCHADAYDTFCAEDAGLLRLNWESQDVCTITGGCPHCGSALPFMLFSFATKARTHRCPQCRRAWRIKIESSHFTCTVSVRRQQHATLAEHIHARGYGDVYLGPARKAIGHCLLPGWFQPHDVPSYARVEPFLAPNQHSVLDFGLREFMNALDLWRFVREGVPDELPADDTPSREQLTLAGA